jgi:hypothetical protein
MEPKIIETQESRTTQFDVLARQCFPKLKLRIEGNELAYYTKIGFFYQAPRLMLTIRDSVDKYHYGRPFFMAKWEPVAITVHDARCMEGAIGLARSYLEKTGFDATIVKSF